VGCETIIMTKVSRSCNYCYNH